MDAPILFPRGLDELLSERRDARKLAIRILDRDGRFDEGVDAFRRQSAWSRRLNALIARRAAA